jgi:predicted kinase
MEAEVSEPKKLVLTQGLPGSGKSYLARQIGEEFGGVKYRDWVVLATDDYFMDDADEYVFDRRKIGEAHAWNRGRAYMSMISGTPLVIIANTNIKKWEMKEYVRMAMIFGYEIEIVRPQTPWANNVAECHKRNTHGVPYEVIHRMAGQMEDIADPLDVLDS